MKAIILDMYGVIVKQTGDEFAPYVQQSAIEKLAVNAAECLYVDDRRGYLGAASGLGMDTILFNSRNVLYKEDVVNNFEELMNRVL